MFILKEVFQNLLMGLRPVAKFAQRHHSTGLNADPVLAKRVFEMFSRFVPVIGVDVLEIGPGHTLEVLEYARAAGARSCVALDINDYLVADAGKNVVQYLTYDGKRLPFDGQQFDLIWSHTAFEHLRYPSVTVAECFRVLRLGGKLVAVIDLGDHSVYGNSDLLPEQLFQGLRYPEWLWNLMKWNRSSYTNRLRKSEWLTLFKEAGFIVRHEESQRNESIDNALPSLPYLHRLTREDAVTSVVTVCLEKSQGPHVASS